MGRAAAFIDRLHLPVRNLDLLEQADAKFKQAEVALKGGDLAAYGKATKRAEALVGKALVAANQAAEDSASAADESAQGKGD